MFWRSWILILPFQTEKELFRQLLFCFSQQKSELENYSK